MQAIHERLDGEMKRGVQERALRPEMADLAAAFFIGMMRALIIRDLLLGKGQGHGGRAGRPAGHVLRRRGRRRDAAVAREQRGRGRRSGPGARAGQQVAGHRCRSPSAR